MNQYRVAASTLEVPDLKVLAHTVTGAIEKAERVNKILFPTMKSTDWSATLVKQNVR
jgi:hypothetical protein